MRPQFEYTKSALEDSVFSKLQVRYLIAILAIALAIIVSQVLVQKFLNKQLNDSRAINVAGRQRMLSQKICKLSLLISYSDKKQDQIKYSEELKESVSLWEQSYKGLVSGDSSLHLTGEISSVSRVMFDSIDPYFNSIVEASARIISYVENEKHTPKSYIDDLNTILENGQLFLEGMDKIVFQMDNEAHSKVTSLKEVEILLLVIALCILVFEVLFIFRPIAKYIKQIVAGLVRSEKDEKKRGEFNLRKKGEEQKLRSTLIFEGQERERRRLARDLHDGIGQLLTGLKFQLEAIDVNKQDIAKQKLFDAKQLTAQIIKEIRRTAFNLRPSVLSDYGLPSVIKQMVQEIQKFTDIEIRFTNLTGFDQRLHKKLESQLYRLVQEAVNNALKHAKANNIQINLWHKSYFVAISIMDDGIGFNHEEVMQKDIKVQAGHGLLHMQERANLINAELSIKSSYGKGTEVSINLPLE